MGAPDYSTLARFVEAGRERSYMSVVQAARTAAAFTPEGHLSDSRWSAMVKGGRYKDGKWSRVIGRPLTWAAMARAVLIVPETLDLAGYSEVAEHLRQIYVKHPLPVEPDYHIDEERLYERLLQLYAVAGRAAFRAAVDRILDAPN